MNMSSIAALEGSVDNSETPCILLKFAKLDLGIRYTMYSLMKEKIPVDCSKPTTIRNMKILFIRFLKIIVF